jgi:hypothetical protein
MVRLTMWFRFLWWSAEFLFVDRRNGLITLVLIVGFVATLVWTARRRHALSLRAALVPLTTALAPLFVLTLGVAYARDPPVTGVFHQGAENAVTATLAVQLLAAAFFLFRAKGLRLLVVAQQALLLWWFFSAAFIAGMSISGDWL